MSAEEELVRELVRIRRGWGLDSRDLRGRVGERLARLCGVQPADSDRDVRDRLLAWLGSHVVELPAELARATAVAFALERDVQHRHLTQRVAWLAREQSCAPRTVRRRMDHALRLVVRAALDEEATQRDPAGRRLRSLRAVLHLGGGTLQLDETCETVVTAGGTGSPDRQGRLPATHESWLAEWTTGSHYTVVPLVPCERFEVEVRMSPGTRLRVRRLEAVPPGRAGRDEPPVVEPADRIEGSTGLRLIFDDLVPRLGYGLMWAAGGHVPSPSLPSD
ncbi:hypothetical protein OHA72_04690 [Dactylosporangium sp. NBC_01737]|uniref:hypothetical protein n=1 Tax=Dactylosporangium sp. NBC_01737 TaxID=2975959 RepID=UPI002E0E8E61|nr:hypothetical protein OHA72_04690 [Dactylosporangium sp. NBC_01737]